VRVEVHDDSPLWFGPGSPVRAASAIAPFGGGWLVAQDDATHAAWLRPEGVTAVRVFAPVEGHDTFSSAEGTKHLKPDLEAAVGLDGGAVLLLGSGSTAARMRGALVTAPGSVTTLELTAVYHRVAAALGLPVDRLNLEGAARIGDRLRWFQRGNSAAGVRSAAVEVSLAALLGSGPVQVGGARSYDLGSVGGVALAVTDAVALPDGRMLVSAAAEDTPNAVDDGPVAGAAIALLDDQGVLAVAAVPGGPYKIEGLALSGTGPTGATLIAVVDADDPLAASRRLDLRVSW
jgi:hypothetical protein